MKKRAPGPVGMAMVAALALGVGGALFSCGSSSHDSVFDAGTGDSGPGTIVGGDDGGGGLGTDGGGLHVGNGDAGGCAGLQCSVVATCGDGGTTTITGKVTDPAGTEPIYNAVAYVPMYDPANPSSIPEGAGIQPITGGVSFPSGVSCDSCSYLFTGNPIAVGTTAADGTFTIPNVPSGTNIPVVVQLGKWRTHTTVMNVPSCGNGDAGTLKLPAKIDGTDPIMSMPQFALSMGGSDSLECLLYRIGIDLSEFVPGPSATGHVHLFSGFGMIGVDGGAPPVPPGYQQLWDSLADLEKYDVSLFSCEGRETTNANPTLLKQYVNAGGRAFTSHYHYAWFTGAIDTNKAKSPLTSDGTVPYSPDPDWADLASWNHTDNGVTASDVIGVKIDTKLNSADGGAFLKGQALSSWLTNVDAFGKNGVPANEVPIKGPAFDPMISTANSDSQQWADYDPSSNSGDSTLATSYPTAYFSFNTPVGAVAPDDGGAAPYCGRVVFTGLHVGAAANDSTTSNNTVQLPSDKTCKPAPGDLSPQEKVLEFILFDLSSCVTADTSAASSPITIR